MKHSLLFFSKYFLVTSAL